MRVPFWGGGGSQVWRWWLLKPPASSSGPACSPRERSHGEKRCSTLHAAMDTWRLLHYESFRVISRRRHCVFSMGNTWDISFFPSPLWARNINNVEKAHRNPSNFLLIQQQRKVTALSTRGERSAHSLCRENEGAMQLHLHRKPKSVSPSSPGTKLCHLGVTLQLTQECTVEAKPLKLSKQLIERAKNMRNLCWKISQKYLLSSCVTEDFG